MTARGEDVDRIVGLELGADDYVPKPFNTRELLATDPGHPCAASKAARRREPWWRLATSPSIPARAPCSAPDRSWISPRLSSTCFAILLENAGNVVPREELAERVLGRRFSPFDRSIDMHISKIRRKLLDESDELIKTVRGTGYIYARPSTRDRREQMRSLFSKIFLAFWGAMAVFVTLAASPPSSSFASRPPIPRWRR